MADQKTTDLSAATPISTDIMAFVDDPPGSPISKKMTFAAFMMLLHDIVKAAVVATNETQASNTTYGALTTPGPALTITHAGTIAIIWVSAIITHGAVGNSAMVCVELSGANTVAATNANAAQISSHAASHNLSCGRVLVLTGLTPGTTTFTLKYQNDGGGTWSFSSRSLAVFCP